MEISAVWLAVVPLIYGISRPSTPPMGYIFVTVDGVPFTNGHTVVEGSTVVVTVLPPVFGAIVYSLAYWNINGALYQTVENGSTARYMFTNEFTVGREAITVDVRFWQ